jgi:hypothetical protein
MKTLDKDNIPKHKVSSADFLAAVPHANAAMNLTHRRDGSAIAEVPLKRPRWLVPPISWLLPFSSQRRVLLDTIGTSVLDLCDGRNTVETIIENFAVRNKLSFREAQLPVTQFLQQMTERGLVAIVGTDKETDK